VATGDAEAQTEMDEPETWRWIWLIAAAVFAGGEMAVAGSFFLAPFAVGAAVATALAFLDVSLAGQWAAFVGISFGAFALMRPLARRLDQGEPSDGIGSRRLIGQAGTVLEAIPAGEHELGLVRVQREEWRAESFDGRPLDPGNPVKVIEQRGTRLVVSPTTPTSPPALSPEPQEP
jgi:membrane protein implicated in regulation of membrane protease activity